MTQHLRRCSLARLTVPLALLGCLLAVPLTDLRADGPRSPIPQLPSVAELASGAAHLDREVLTLALDAAAEVLRRGEAERSDILTVIDYSLPSTEKRLWVFDLSSAELLFREWVAHGKNTGANLAQHFSNVEGSKQSSYGLFRTGGTYHGGNGYSMRLHGLEPGVNDLALERLIVMHGAWYVSEEMIENHGRLGRSWGCPALREAVAADVIDAIEGGSLVFVYYPDEDWLATSPYLRHAGATGTSVPSAR